MQAIIGFNFKIFLFICLPAEVFHILPWYAGASSSPPGLDMKKFD